MALLLFFNRERRKECYYAHIILSRPAQLLLEVHKLGEREQKTQS